MVKDLNGLYLKEKKISQLKNLEFIIWSFQNPRNSEKKTIT